MDTKKVKILAKIQALLQKTVENGCSEEEAVSAANMAQRLLSNYNLTMSEVEYASSDFEEIIIDTGKKNRDYMYRLMNAIAAFTDCETFYRHGGYDVVGNKYEKRTLKYIYFGEKASVETANYIFSLLQNAIEYEVRKYFVSDKYQELITLGYASRTLMNSFRTGMAIRLAQRLREIKAEREQQNIKENGIQLYDRMAIVKKKFDVYSKDLNIGSASRFVTSVHGGALESGEKAAESVEIIEGRKEGIGQTLMLE